jgi:hypothetical protein
VKNKITIDEELLKTINSSLDKFIDWLEDYGETSYDFETFFASNYGRRAKALYYKKPLLGTIAVAPLIFFEAFIPSARRLFWQRQRFPIADAHYAMGFALLSQLSNNTKYYEKAVHFLNVLEQTRCPGYQHYCWGYPYGWETRAGAIKKNMTLIKSTPYVYEAFKEVHVIDKKEKWLEIMRSIAEHALHDIKDFETSPDASTCSYTPYDKGGVINASAYRASLLTNAYTQFSENKYWQVAERNINFVIQSQRSNGSWYYAMDGKRNFVDHFHTCFVLKALVKIEHLTGHKGCTKAIERGIRYYLKELFDEKGLPKPFSKAPRLIVYKRELYNYAECINLATLLKNRFEELDNILAAVIEDILSRWQKVDGSFRSRQLFLGWDNVPMHRWAQSQLFRSLSFLLYQQKVHPKNR